MNHRLAAWLVMLAGVFYFFVPLLGTFEFSLRYLRGVYSLEAYRIVLADPRFGATLTYSTVLALGMIVITGLSNAAYIWLRGRSERWLR